MSQHVLIALGMPPDLEKFKLPLQRVIALAQEAGKLERVCIWGSDVTAAPPPAVGPASLADPRSPTAPWPSERHQRRGPLQPGRWGGAGCRAHGCGGQGL